MENFIRIVGIIALLLISMINLQLAIYRAKEGNTVKSISNAFCSGADFVLIIILIFEYLDF